MEVNKLYLGDCYELIKNTPDKSIDLVIIDPPYEIASGGAMTGIFKDRDKRHFNSIEDNNLTKGFDIKILDELVRVMKNVNIYIWCNKNQVRKILNYFDDGNRLFEIIIWNRTNPTPFVNNNWLNDKEYCIYFRDKRVALKGGYETKKTVLTQSANIGDKQNYNHPTIKPLQFIKNFIINSSNENDIVLDCFAGSGTTLVASKELGRNYIGMEINEEYYKIALDRLNGVSAIDREKMDRGQISLFWITISTN